MQRLQRRHPRLLLGRYNRVTGRELRDVALHVRLRHVRQRLADAANSLRGQCEHRLPVQGRLQAVGTDARPGVVHALLDRPVRRRGRLVVHVLPDELERGGTRRGYQRLRVQIGLLEHERPRDAGLQPGAGGLRAVVEQLRGGQVLHGRGRDDA